jgi:hypothetical protein
MYHSWEKMFVGTPEGERELGKSGRRRKDNVEMDLQKKWFVTL